MQVASRSPAQSLAHVRDLAAAPTNLPHDPPPLSSDESEARDIFHKFVGGTFFQEMFKAMRKTQGKAHYVDGGKAEEIFRSQFDQQISEQLAKQHGPKLCGTMTEPFLKNIRARTNARSQSPASQLNRLA